MFKYLIAGIVCLVVGYFVILYLYMKNLKRKKLVYTINEDGKVKIAKDIIYKTADGKNLLMDVYTPAEANYQDKLPVVIFVHGEGPEIFIKDAKDWGVYTSYGKLLASKGYIAITFNHRYAAKNFYKIKEVSEDVIDAVKYVQANSTEWNIDLDKVFVWSFSLGGIYSSVFLNNCCYNVRAVISYYGLLDINTQIPLEMQNDYDDFTPNKYLRNVRDTKILIVKAVKDKIKGVNQSIDNFIETADKYRVEYEYMLHSSGGHSFDVLIDNEETIEIIEKTLSFIESNSR